MAFADKCVVREDYEALYARQIEGVERGKQTARVRKERGIVPVVLGSALKGEGDQVKAVLVRSKGRTYRPCCCVACRCYIM